VGFQAVSDALQLLLIFGVNLRPENGLRHVAIEIPLALGAVRVAELDGIEAVLNFGRQKIAMLIPDVCGRALEVDVNPLAALEAVGRLQPGGIALARSRTICSEARAAPQRAHHQYQPKPDTTALCHPGPHSKPSFQAHSSLSACAAGLNRSTVLEG
jgi:hypothetical protein